MPEEGIRYNVQPLRILICLKKDMPEEGIQLDTTNPDMPEEGIRYNVQPLRILICLKKGLDTMCNHYES